MSPAAAAAALAAAATLLARADRLAARARSRRLAVISAADGEPAGRRAARSTVPLTAAGAVLLAALVGLRPAAAVLIPAAAALLAVRGARRAGQRRRADAAAAALPLAAELLAACLSAGAAPADALDAVAREVGPPLNARLRPVAAALRAGRDPRELAGPRRPPPWWRTSSDRLDDPVHDLVRALGRAADTGSALAGSVRALADDARHAQRWAAEAAARRAAVHAVGPLVLCFLPAFVLLAVAPVVVGMLGAFLTGVR